MAPHSSPLAWEVPWMEEPSRLQSMGSWRVGHDRTTSLSLFTFMYWRGKWQPTPVLLPGESQRREPGGLRSLGSHRVRQDWRDLAAAAAEYRAGIQTQVWLKPVTLCSPSSHQGGYVIYERDARPLLCLLFLYCVPPFLPNGRDTMVLENII